MSYLSIIFKAGDKTRLVLKKAGNNLVTDFSFHSVGSVMHPTAGAGRTVVNQQFCHT